MANVVDSPLSLMALVIGIIWIEFGCLNIQRSQKTHETPETQ